MDKRNIKTDNYDKFIFKAPLAIESYIDMNELDDESNSKVNEMYCCLKEYRSLSEKTPEDKKNIVNKIVNIIRMLGNDNFVVYDDGDVEVDYDYGKQAKGGNNNV